MDTIKGIYKYEVCKFSSGITVGSFKSEDKVTFPDGRASKTFKAKGYNFPEIGLEVELAGEWKAYKGDYTFEIHKLEEVIPTRRDAVIRYLTFLEGVGPALAERLWEEFYSSVFEVMENDPEKLAQVKGISKRKAEKIAASYGKRKFARELFEFLLPYDLTERQIMKIYRFYPENPVNLISENPFLITDIAGIGFQTADTIRKKLKLSPSMPERIKSGILEVLLESEMGGSLFRESSSFPDFMHYGFLRTELETLMRDRSIYVTGNTYMGIDLLYLFTLKLLGAEVPESDFYLYIKELRRQGKLIIAKDESGKHIIYRYHTAESEYKAARMLTELMDREIKSYPNLPSLLKEAQNELEVLLTDQQKDAVKKAITCPVSVITGGPGTGKTSVQRCILSVYSALHPEKKIVLCAPTGMAAKRMAESTGHEAGTLHKTLQIFQDQDGNLIDSSDTFLDAGLIIVDECSMIGSHVFKLLLDHVKPGTNLVLVGDSDQLPSIEVGSVLKSVIESGCLYVTRLTKTFRQASGSRIAINAARIRKGEEILEYGDDFKLVERETSQEISDTLCGLYRKLVEKEGIDNVMVLSPFRRSTESGTDQLNQALRSAIRNDITAETPSFTSNGMTIYVGDRVMFTKNTEALTNGDIGYVRAIKKEKGSLEVTVEFDGAMVKIEDDEVFCLELSYAMTVHKSQGAESKVVLMVSDTRHSGMMKRNLSYTAITRAKKEIIIVGMQEALTSSINHVDTHLRRSRLDKLIQEYEFSSLEEKISQICESTRSPEQLSML